MKRGDPTADDNCITVALTCSKYLLRQTNITETSQDGSQDTIIHQEDSKEENQELLDLNSKELW